MRFDPHDRYSQAAYAAAWAYYQRAVERDSGVTAAILEFRQWYGAIREWIAGRLLDSGNAFRQRAGRRMMAWRKGAWHCQCGKFASPQHFILLDANTEFAVTLGCKCGKSWDVIDKVS